MGNLIKEGSEEHKLLQQIKKEDLPVHIAIIMDGNGRWSQQRDLERIEGHKKGIESAKEVVECAGRLGIKYLTLFTFSSENWKRPISEVNKLMDILYENLNINKKLLIDSKMKLKVLGDLTQLPKKLVKRLKETEELSKDFPNLQVNLALNYGARMEILTAVKKIIDDKISSKNIKDELFKNYLYTTNIPDPDLLVRTSGEFRISNFLLYQIAYTELYFTETLWPDFRIKEFLTAIIDFQKRNRRFGNI